MKSKLINALLSLAIAFGLWLYVITVVSPNFETTYTDIPVAMQGESVLEERGLMVTSVETPKVELRLSGNRIELNKMTSANISLMVDLSKISEEGTQSVLYTITYPGNVNFSSFEVLSKNPSQIRLTVEKRVTKQVKVRPVYSGAVPEGFIADKENAVLDYTEITVTGPASVVEQIEQARVEINLENQTETISQSFAYTLCNADGEPVDAAQVVTNVGEVYLTLTIQQTKEVKLVLTVNAGGGATEQTSNITIEPETIQICGSGAVLADIDEINIGTIELGELTKDTKLTFAINTPPGVTNLSEVAEATVHVRFPDLRMTTLTVTNITPTNVPEGMEVELVTKVLYVTVRGPKTLVDTMTDANISATIDFTYGLLGLSNYTATIVIDKEFAAVGAVGTYSVNATLREADAEADTP